RRRRRSFRRRLRSRERFTPAGGLLGGALVLDLGFLRHGRTLGAALLVAHVGDVGLVRVAVVRFAGTRRRGWLRSLIVSLHVAHARDRLLFDAPILVRDEARVLRLLDVRVVALLQHRERPIGLRRQRFGLHHLRLDRLLGLFGRRLGFLLLGLLF